MKNWLTFITLVGIVLPGCIGSYTPPVFTAPYESAPSGPDYSMESNWASLPWKKDNADKVPASSGMNDMQETSTADVFFIHPTSFLKQTEVSKGWNADLRDAEINKRTDEGSILYQASVFNGAGKIYAPRYRQAFIAAYYTTEKDKARQAFDTAYSDVRLAFDYYLAHYNHGRPFIIASHSQGTTHAIRLLKDYLDNDKSLSGKLIAAYLIGMDVYDTLFTVLQPCHSAGDNGCYVTWRTYAKGYYPEGYKKPYRDAVCTNPLTWSNDSAYAGRELNNGGVLKRFDKVISHLCDAQVEDGVLRIEEPRFNGRIFYNFKNYHIVDYNLFYMNIRENARDRVRLFTDRKPQSQ